MRGLILVNPSAGQDRDVDMAEALRHHLGDSVADIEPLPEHGLERRVAKAVEAGVPFVGAAGGDGTVRSVAQLLTDGEVPLLVVPGGTRNHFARAVGTGSLEEVAEAVRPGGTGRVHHVDVGEVQGEIFLNNAGLGSYPQMVLRREQREDRHSKRVATLIAAIEELRYGRHARLSIDRARPQRVWSLFVGNGRYGSDVSDLSSRASLTDGELDIAVAIADGALSRPRIAWAIATGRMKEHELIERRVSKTLSVAARRPGPLTVALDGEVCHLAGPLEFRSRPGALPVLVPAAPASD